MAENKVILIYGSLTEQAWSIKDLLYGLRGNFSCGIRRVVPCGQDTSILPARVANHSARFGSSCPLTEIFFLFLQYAILLSKTLQLQTLFTVLAQLLTPLTPTIQYNTIQYNTIQYNTIKHNTIQYNAMQGKAMQCNTVQYNTIRYASA